MTVRFKVTKRRALIALPILALLLTAAAFAAWTILSSDGAAGGKVGTLSAPTVVASTANNGAACYPSVPCDLNVKVTNANGALVITGWQAATSSSLDSSSDPTNCPTSNITLNVGSGQNIALPNGTTDNIVLPGAVTLASNAPTACQGTTFRRGVRLNISTP